MPTPDRCPTCPSACGPTSSSSRGSTGSGVCSASDTQVRQSCTSLWRCTAWPLDTWRVSDDPARWQLALVGAQEQGSDRLLPEMPRAGDRPRGQEPAISLPSTFLREHRPFARRSNHQGSWFKDRDGAACRHDGAGSASDRSSHGSPALTKFAFARASWELQNEPAPSAHDVGDSRPSTLKNWDTQSPSAALGARAAG